MALRHITLLFIFAFLLGSCGGADESGDTLPDLPTSEAPVTEVVVESGGPALPHGRLLFVKRGDIWMFEGSGIRRLTASGKTVQPGWAPQSQRIVYVQREESYSDIYIKSIGVEGRGTQLTRHEPAGIAARSLQHVSSVRWGFYPAWSPDGGSLAYISQRYAPYCANGGHCDLLMEYPLSLYLYHIANADAGVLASPENNLVLVKEDTDLSHPVWSPDGRYLAFTEASRYPPPGESGVRIGFYDVETGDAFQLPRLPDGAYDPAWSPDGTWLVFARRDGANTELWAVASPGVNQDGIPFQLTQFGNVRSPTWSPDGSHLAFFRLGEGSVDLQVAPVQLSADGRPTLGDPETILENEMLDVDSGMAWGP